MNFAPRFILLVASLIALPACSSLPAIIDGTQKVLSLIAEASAAVEAARALVDHLVAVRPDLAAHPAVKQFRLSVAKAETALQHAAKATTAARRAEAAADPAVVFAEFKAAWAETSALLATIEAAARSTGVPAGTSLIVETPEAAR
jgi:hypothetical protein